MASQIYSPAQQDALAAAEALAAVEAELRAAHEALAAAKAELGAAQEDLTAAKVALGDALGNVRLRAGKPSYRQLQRRGFSYSPATITRVLRGETIPRWEFVEEFLELCGISPIEIERVWRPRWVSVAALNQHNKSTVPDALISHNGTGQHAPTGTECTICGAWVINTDRHEEWHNTLAPRRSRWLRSVQTTSEPLNSRDSMLG